MSERPLGEERYWVCIIGPVHQQSLPDGADAPPRSAAILAVEAMGCAVETCSSGWGQDAEIIARVEDILNAPRN